MTRIPGDSLIDDIKFILDGSPARVIDVGCHLGDTSRHYLEAFPSCELWGFEAEAKNFARAQTALAAYGERVHLFCNAVSSQSGPVTLNVNSHDGTHSMFEIGDQRYWAAHAAPLEARTVTSVRLDDALAEIGAAPIDLLHMDIQGAELDALRGAERLLRDCCATAARLLRDCCANGASG